MWGGTPPTPIYFPYGFPTGLENTLFFGDTRFFFEKDGFPMGSLRVAEREKAVAEQAVSQACAGALLFDFAEILSFGFAFALGTQATHTNHK